MADEATGIPAVNSIAMIVRVDSPVYRIEAHYCGNTMLSKTFLHHGQETRGHQHNLSESYYFIKGTGEMFMGIESLAVQPGAVTTVPPNVFHKVHNLSQGELGFLGIWDKVISINGIKINSNKQSNLAENAKSITVAVAGGFDPFLQGHMDHIKKTAQVGNFLYFFVCNDSDMIRGKREYLIPLDSRVEILSVVIRGLSITGAIVPTVDEDGTMIQTLRQYRIYSQKAATGPQETCPRVR